MSRRHGAARAAGDAVRSAWEHIRRPAALRAGAHLVGEIALVWLMAAATAASFAPRGISLDVHDQMQLASPSALGGLAVVLPAAGLCAGLWWLLGREFIAPLAVAAGALLVAALFLPGGMTLYFLPPPIALLAVAWVLRWAPDPEAPADRGG